MASRLLRLAVLLMLFGTFQAILPSNAQAATMYKWLPTESAPTAYPVKLIQGLLSFPGGGRVAVPDDRNVNNGWGQRGSVHIVGDPMKPVPERLDITWFSYTEDKFYTGAFALPQKAMADLFAAGLPADRLTGKPIGYDRIIVGMAPGGLVVVWMAAGPEVVEVASFQAQDSTVAWDRVTDNKDLSRQEYVRKLLEIKLGAAGLAQLDKDGVPARKYNDYRSPFAWQATLGGQGTTAVVQAFNGENWFVGPKGPWLARPGRPVPSMIELEWTSSTGQPRAARVHFDEAEAFAAFRKLSRDDPKRAFRLLLEPSDAGVGVSLRDDQYVLPLQKVRVELFRKR